MNRKKVGAVKKFVIVAMVLALCASLVGCGAYFDALEDVGSAYQEEMDKILGEIAGDTPSNSDSTGATDSTVAENNTDDTEPSKETESIQITMPYDSWHYTGHERPVGHIVSDLEKLGFTNITTIEVDSGLFYFAVEDVEIFSAESNKMVHFDEGDTFPADALIEVYYYGGPMEDGMIQETNIFTIDQKLKSVEGYTWSSEHSVIEGRTGYLGDCYCKDKNIWVSLYGNDLEEITLASIDVFEEDYELLITFVSFFDTSLIDAEEVQQWVREYNPENGSATKVFGDAEFSLHFGMENEDKYSLYITALE